jgi:hypothetical protein
VFSRPGPAPVGAGRRRREPSAGTRPGGSYAGAVVAPLVVDARRASIVAFHGGLPGPLAELVESLQRAAADRLGPAFAARPPDTVHATVIGLETPPPAHAGTDRSRFDAGPLVAHLVGVLTERPLELCFGGAVEGDRRRPSRGCTRYERSFLVGPADVVLIGWPVRGDRTVPVPALAAIRHGCEPYGARHRYHTSPGADDPDAYLVIGRLTGPPGPAAAELADAARRTLAAGPVRVRLGPEQLSLVEYADTALPLESTRRRPLLGL